MDGSEETDPPEHSEKSAPAPEHIESQREELAAAESEAESEVEAVVEEAVETAAETAEEAAETISEAVEEAAEEAVQGTEHLTENDIPRIADHIFERLREAGHIPPAETPDDTPVEDEGEPEAAEPVHEQNTDEPVADSPPKKTHWWYK